MLGNFPATVRLFLWVNLFEKDAIMIERNALVDFCFILSVPLDSNKSPYNIYS